ncbi:putative 2og-fe oxygenase protein [Phaeoacremonium minimum UCRPA7]|uniref:Putative 2og-fe oxygenase protein n=1 Tax=Phaeoacremonium minimum (strain UCR-PA7) TaxID=1286976 RepID=R8BWH0_PHAM7|nr:putative 2og-fe oxygenase protein [Phaeoacremonium minimum UCRPA7]EOO03693.1 putative 2og-fe oxygenase protein [Phaeoacremonium minimum UCRPA7]
MQDNSEQAGAITLLLQDDSGGLEVLNHNTGEWIPVDPNPDAYVVNIGDMLSMWTKNIYKSNVHRVINKSTKDRYSMPFFFDGNADVKLTPFDGSEPVGGKVLTVEEHMLERFGTTYGRAEQVEATA